MYMGVKNHHDLPRVTSYADAERALATWEQRRKRGTEVVDVRREIDNAIHFRLYSTDVVVWYLDDSVEIDNYGTVTTSQFAHRFLPAGIHLHYPVVRRGSSGGANTIGYTGRDEDGKHVYALCQGDVVRFCGTLDGRWVPDLDTCYDITLPVGVDRKQSRKLARELHFAEFETWLAMAPMHLGDVEHDFWDLHECMSA